MINSLLRIISNYEQSVLNSRSEAEKQHWLNAKTTDPIPILDSFPAKHAIPEPFFYSYRIIRVKRG